MESQLGVNISCKKKKKERKQQKLYFESSKRKAIWQNKKVLDSIKQKIGAFKSLKAEGTDTLLMKYKECNKNWQKKKSS